MSESKDVVDYLHERKQLEQKLHDLHAKENLLPTEEVIIEEVERRLRIVIKQIEKLS